jgi:hypothetical protein
VSGPVVARLSNWIVFLGTAPRVVWIGHPVRNLRGIVVLPPLGCFCFFSICTRSHHRLKHRVVRLSRRLRFLAEVGTDKGAAVLDETATVVTVVDDELVGGEAADGKATRAVLTRGW